MRHTVYEYSTIAFTVSGLRYSVDYSNRCSIVYKPMLCYVWYQVCRVQSTEYNSELRNMEDGVEWRVASIVCIVCLLCMAPGVVVYRMVCCMDLCISI